MKIWIDRDGYYVKSFRGNIIRLHRTVMEKLLKRKLKSNEIVHHIDHNRLNNKIDNLMVVTALENKKLNYYLWKYLRTLISPVILKYITLKALEDIRDD